MEDCVYEELGDSNQNNFNGGKQTGLDNEDVE